jgi:hypothetical protein
VGRFNILAIARRRPTEFDVSFGLSVNVCWQCRQTAVAECKINELLDQRETQTILKRGRMAG